MIKNTYFSLLLIIMTVSCNVTENSNWGIITASKLNIRQKPHKQSRIIGQIPKGDTVIVVSITKDFTRIKTKDGVSGFASSRYIKKEPPDSFLYFLKTADINDSIPILLLLLGLSLAIVRLVSYILRKISSIDTHYAPAFEFTLTNKNSFFNRKYNSTVYLLLGRNNQHPYLNYWIYISLFWVLIPFFFIGGIVLLELNDPNFTKALLGISNIDYPITTGLIFLLISISVTVFIYKTAKNSKRFPKKEWIPIIISLVFSIPIIFISLILSLRWLVIMALSVFVYFGSTFTKLDWQHLHEINGGDPEDYI